MSTIQNSNRLIELVNYNCRYHMETETELNLYFKTMRLFLAIDRDTADIKENLRYITFFRNKYRGLDEKGKGTRGIVLPDSNLLY
jgi:hypothetical protein